MTIKSGFTLIEILIALAIFAVLSVLAFSGLSNVLEINQHNQQALNKLQGIQVGYSKIANDLQHLIERSIRSEYDQILPPIVANNLEPTKLEFTRSGILLPGKTIVQKPSRIAYTFKNDQIIRSIWQVLDRSQDSQAIEEVIFNEAEAFEIRLIDDQGKWHRQWGHLAFISSESKTTLAAIETTITFKKTGKIKRLFMVPQHAPLSF
ncbi:MAG: type II secretion system minor pseudopilin GspJ [Methylococcales bacterium]|jgi:general secretion pathway protein J|nr:type II secretion system minor pseudopilin GspJ [Methylococcales bacterium]MBT7409450.1 type II secretion system minor pseudopilin GspJ [Methylococcales bacterium]